jgi:hypothetical protein
VLTVVPPMITSTSPRCRMYIPYIDRFDRTWGLPGFTWIWWHDARYCATWCSCSEHVQLRFYLRIHPPSWYRRLRGWAKLHLSSCCAPARWD